MKKIIAILLLMAMAVWVWADNYNSSTEGTYGSGTAYFSSAMDSSWWVLAYPNSGNPYDTISGYALGEYQSVDSVDLDSIGVHYVTIYGFSGGAYSDSIVGVWEHRGTAKIDSIHDEVGRRGVYPSLHAKLGSWGDSVGHSMSFALSEYIYDMYDSLKYANALLVDIEDDSSGGSGSCNDGTGNAACTLIVQDSAASKIEGARIWVYNSDRTSTKIYGRLTDSNGKLIVNLDSTYDYIVVIRHNNYDQIEDTITINQDSTWTEEMQLMTPGLCTVYGWVYDINGDSLGGVTVSAYVPEKYTPIRYNSKLISQFSRSTVSLASGYWSLPLIAPGYMEDTTTVYVITAGSYEGEIGKAVIHPPNQANWAMPDSLWKGLKP